MNPRARLLSALVFVIALGAFVSGNGRVLALAVPLLVYVGAGLLARGGVLQFDVTRTLSAARAAPGSLVEVTLSITNRGDRVEELLVQDEPPLTVFRGRGAAQLVTRLDVGESASWRYAVSGERGEHTWGSIVLEARARCDIFPRTAVHHLETRLLVYPRLVTLGAVEVRPRQTRGFAGPLPARLPGPGVSFLGVRDYRGGDPLRWVNWRISSRQDHLLVTNEFEQERIADVGIVLDARDRSYPARAEALWEAAVLAAGSLAERFLLDGNRVALLVYGHSWERVQPGYGRFHRSRVRDQLARARRGTNWALQSLAWLPTRMFPARSQVIFVSPLHPEDRAVLVALRARGYSVAVISPDPTAEEARLGSGGHSHAETAPFSTALRLAGLERSLLIAGLRRAGVSVVDWRCGDAPAETLRSSLARQPLWERAGGNRR